MQDFGIHITIHPQEWTFQNTTLTIGRLNYDIGYFYASGLIIHIYLPSIHVCIHEMTAKHNPCLLFQNVSLEFAPIRHSDGPETAVWLSDGNLNYLTGKHISLFVLGVILCSLASVYTLILLFIQCLQKRSIICCH